VLTIHAARQRLCDGTNRRDFLRLGALGGLGLSLPELLRVRAAQAASTGHFGRAKRCVLLFLTGGPPQSDTFDLKPDAPAEYRGELKPIATNVPGVQISELLPRLARHMDRCCLVRSVTHGDRVHTSAGYTMLTGATHPLANGRSAADIRPGPHDHPHIGALLARARPSANGLPVFASLPEVIRDAGVNTYPGLDGGLLGKQFAPFRVEATPDRSAFQLPDVFLPSDITADRLADRRVLLDRIDNRLNTIEMRQPIRVMDTWYDRAFALLRAPAIQEAFDLRRESDRLRDDYGRHLFGQGCLLTRRLLEAGIALVSVYWHYEGPDDSPVWDTHQNNFMHLRHRLMPPTDHALAALLKDLAQRGLLDETLVICMGEFGRTPKVNKLAGRDHWAAVQSVLLAGAGLRGGSVYGASDRLAAFPTDQPVTPADLTATILHLLGVPLDMEIRDRTDRPIAACEGKPIQGLLA
jgi:hypothetical protein